MVHRLEPLFSRIYDEHREFLAHGAGIPIRRVPVDAGTIEICGDQAALDRRGRHAVTYVNTDRLLAILDLVDEAEVAERCAQYQHAELEELEPYTVLFRGKPRHFQATSKSFLMGVCDCGDATILVASLDGGLAFSIHTRKGWSWVLEPRPSWTTLIDLDAELGGKRSRASKAAMEEPPTRARAVSEPSPRPRARARRDEDRDDEVCEHHARLSQGLPDGLEILEICLEEFSRKAMLPHDCFRGNHKRRTDVPEVVAGLLHAAAHGCVGLGGREKDMLAALRTYGVVLPRGALSGVLRLFLLLDCPLVSQPKPAKDRGFSKLWRLDFALALDVADPRHLDLVRSLRTPPRPREPDEHEREGEEADDEPRTAAPASDPRAQGPREGAREPASKPGDTAGVAVDPSPQQSQSTALPKTLQTFMRLMLGALTLLAQQVVTLHQRVEATELAAQAARDHVEPATAAEEHCEPAASVDVGEDVVESTAGADRRIDLDATATAGADQRPGEQLADLVEATAAAVDPRPSEQLADLVEATAAAVDPRPGPDELTANTGLTLDRWSFAPSMFCSCFDAQTLVTSGTTAHTITWPAADPVAAAPIENDVHDDPWPTDSASHAIIELHEPSLDARTLALDRWNFATVMFLVMFELEDPFLVRQVVMKVIAWMAEAEGRVEMTRATFWPRARNLPGAHHQTVDLACAERLYATRAWEPAQVELVDAGPRGPPPLGC